MNTNNIASIFVIVVIVCWILLNGSNKTHKIQSKEKFDQIISESLIPAKLKEMYSVNSIGSNPPMYDKPGRKSIYGNLSLPELNLKNSLGIDYRNISFVKSRVINVSKPISIDLTYIDIEKFPIKLYFYNSTPKDLSLNLIFGSVSDSSQVILPLTCVSNYMTNDVNKLSLSLNSYNKIKYSLITNSNYISYGKQIFHSNGSRLYFSGIVADVDNIITQPNDMLASFMDSFGGTTNVTATPAPTPAPTPTPTPAPAPTSN